MAPLWGSTGRGDTGLVLVLKGAPRPLLLAGPAKQAQPVRLQGPEGLSLLSTSGARQVPQQSENMGGP